MTEKAVEFINFTYKVGRRTLLHDLNLTISQGEVLVLLGRSGSGKTTTLKAINKLINPTRGEVLVLGKPTTSWDAIQLRRQIGYAIQETGLFPHLTVAENVGVVPKLQGWPEARRRHRVGEMLELVGLPPQLFAKRYPHQLSGGQRQRVGVARALAADPPLLLMDEPFGAIDPITRLELQQEFRRLHSQLGKTVVFVTHDILEAFLLGTKIGLLQDGRLVTLGNQQEFLTSSHPEAQAFINCLHTAKMA